MFDFDDDEFGLDDLIEADIQYGLFEEDAKKIYKKRNKNEFKPKQKNLFLIHSNLTNSKGIY